LWAVGFGRQGWNVGHELALIWAAAQIFASILTLG
jgi:hypothetical protein